MLYAKNKTQINNHQRIKQIVNDVGEGLCTLNSQDTSPKKTNLAKELIVQIAGVILKIKPRIKERLINARHKWKQRMQWTIESAHNLLQIRAAMASKDWGYLGKSSLSMYSRSSLDYLSVARSLNCQIHIKRSSIYQSWNYVRNAGEGQSAFKFLLQKPFSQ